MYNNGDPRGHYCSLRRQSFRTSLSGLPSNQPVPRTVCEKKAVDRPFAPASAVSFAQPTSTGINGELLSEYLAADGL